MSLLQSVIAGMDSNWAEDATLYFQDELTEISLPDFAKSLSSRTLLQMYKLKYRTERRSNAEFMSPTGKVPVFRHSGALLTGFNDLVSYVNIKTKSLDSHLDDKARCDMNAYMAMVEGVLSNAEVYIAWNDSTVANEVTKPRYGSTYPWPLCQIIPYFKQKEMMKILSAQGWCDISQSEVCERVRRCCQALSVKLGNQQFFFGDQVTPLDALVFGHLFAIVTTVLPNNLLSSVIQDFDNLQELLRRINETYFTDEQVVSPKMHAKAKESR
ncbi:hypothetical protein EB796_015893 [Bugula neritina]|uniref:MTX2 n=1 Tax=Bugula neritina TaxID=10212 RepID=A0A7J7JH20_BUGNE|nr:hypothetical protein EB796_015893 [Bugula neritina]